MCVTSYIPGMEEQPPPVGWLQFFFSDYLPASPCPPGCLHRTPLRAGSLSSGTPSSEGFCVGLGDQYSSLDKFSPIAMSLEKGDTGYSEGSLVGYPEDGFRSSEEELRQIDDLISIYSERLSESESVASSRRNSPSHSPPHPQYSPVKRTSPFSDTDLVRCGKCTSSNVVDCLFVNWACSAPRNPLSVPHAAHTRKVQCNASTQCLFSDIVSHSYDAVLSSKADRRPSADDDTLTKTRKSEGRTCDEHDISEYSEGENISEISETCDATFSIDQPSMPTTVSPSSRPTTTMETASLDPCRDSICSPLLKDGRLRQFPPFVIDFFQFAARPEDYLTAEQLEWYYEVSDHFAYTNLVPERDMLIMRHMNDELSMLHVSMCRVSIQYNNDSTV